MAVTTEEAPDISAAMVMDPVPLTDWLVVAPVAVPILGGALLLMLRRYPRWQPPGACLVLALLVAAGAGLLGHVWSSGPVVMTMGRWLPPFGISFAADVTGAAFALTGAVVALAACLFSWREIDVAGRRYGFYPFLVLMMAGVSGAFLTGDLFNLYVWFEVLLIASFGLAVLGNGPVQLDGAIKYAVLNLIATTIFLIATGYLYGTLGTLNMADIAMRLGEPLDGRPLGAIAGLFLLAFGMKAAAFPVNFWLPASYHTPNIVVSALFAGLLTKVGVYALLRVFVLLMPALRQSYAELILWVAIATMLIGSLGALAHSDLRRLLGYVVISGIGVMLAGLALGSAIGVAGTVSYAIHSMLVMTALYLLAGVAGRMNAGTYDIAAMGGLYGASPLLAAMMLVLTFAVSGLPPFSGFWPKVVLTQAALLEGRWLLAGSVLLTGLLTSLALGRAFAQGFWRGGAAATTPDGAERSVAGLGEGSRAAFFGPVALLTVLIVLLGVVPGPLLAVGDRGAAGLTDPGAYLRAVFPEG